MIIPYIIRGEKKKMKVFEEKYKRNLRVNEMYIP